jgi:lipoprotein signal peptidase
MWLIYFILALFVVVLILSLRNGVAYGMGFNQKKSESPVMYWFQIVVYAGIIAWLICWLLLNR